MHLGAPRIWYGIPREYFLKFESFLKKKFPELSEHPELLHKLVSEDVLLFKFIHERHKICRSKLTGMLIAQICVCISLLLNYSSQYLKLMKLWKWLKSLVITQPSRMAFFFSILRKPFTFG